MSNLISYLINSCFSKTGLFYILVGSIMFLIGIHCFFSRKRMLNFSLMLLILSGAFYLISRSILISIPDELYALLCAKHIVFLAMALISPNVFLFIMAYFHSIAQNRRWIILNYIFALTFYILIGITDYFIPGVQKTHYGWYPIFGKGIYIFFSYFFFNMLITFYILSSRIIKEHSKLKKRNYILILISFFFAYLTSIDILPGFDIDIYPLGFIPLFIFSLIITYSIYKYHLFEISPTVTSQAIIRTLAESLIVTDLKGTIIKANEPLIQLTGYRQNEIIGHSIKKIFKQAKLQEIRNESANYKTFVQCKNKKKIPVVFSWSGFYNKKNELLGYVGVGRDIREIIELQNKERKSRKKAEERLWKLERSRTAMIHMLNDLNTKSKKLRKTYEHLKMTQSQLIHSEKMAGIGQLAAGVAHELNNPMGYVINNLTVLNAYIKDLFKLIYALDNLYSEKNKAFTKKQFSTIKKQMDKIKNQFKLEYIYHDVPELINETLEGAERIKNIVLNLTNFAHPSEGKLQIADINEEIKKALAIVWNEIRFHCEVKKDLQPLPMVMCNPGQLDQVFVNFLINAKQAIDHKKGLITIKTSMKDNTVQIEFSDNGKGIQKKHIDKIFEPFFTTKEVGKGTGLGLSIAYNIIKSHQGTIDVTSKLNKGTTFIIKIPASSPTLL